jgi:putative protein-disulfide isomerase
MQIKLLSIFACILFMSFQADSQTENTKASLICVGDPMCFWCYGFAPELTAVKEQWQDSLNFEIIVGGLRPDENHMLDANLKSLKIKAFIV